MAQELGRVVFSRDRYARSWSLGDRSNPKVKTPPRPRIPQPATPKAQVAPKVVKPVESAKPQANEKSGIDAALDGIE